MNKKTVLAIGRWMPIHIGHKRFLVDLARKYDTLVVGIGSCYENGTPRNCIPAVEREKLLRTIFSAEGVDNYIIVHVPDRPTFEEWFSDVASLCRKYDVTHFCTGNKEDILDVMRAKGLEMKTELINPEDTSDFPYHATDIRAAILAGETERLDGMIPGEIKSAVLSQVAKEIKMANEGKGQEFVPGRQTVDMVFVVCDKEKNDRYLLIGKRDSTKIDFPDYYAIPGGGICEFESPADAVVRCFAAETGIEIAIDDFSVEPALVTLKNLGDKSSEMYFTGIYASRDESINGTRGGGSQCFAVVIEDSVDNVRAMLHSTHDMVELLLVAVDDVHSVDFAYDQKRMVYNALAMLGISFDYGEELACFNEDGTRTGRGVARLTAHRNGTLHGASHTYLYRIDDGKLMILLQRRSYNKDSYPGCLDTSSAGHMEYGADFVETAVKELYEELGLIVRGEELEELFSQRIRSESHFHGHDFIDNEINKIYAMRVSDEELKYALQPEEVCEVVWMSAEQILGALDSESSELCVSPDEMRKVIDILSSRIDKT